MLGQRVAVCLLEDARINPATSNPKLSVKLFLSLCSRCLGDHKAFVNIRGDYFKSGSVADILLVTNAGLVKSRW